MIKEYNDKQNEEISNQQKQLNNVNKNKTIDKPNISTPTYTTKATKKQQLFFFNIYIKQQLMADNNKDYQISEQALNSLNDFKTKMEICLRRAKSPHRLMKARLDITTVQLMIM